MPEILQDAVALVTGASRGIGKAIALELGHQGALVIGTATTKGGADNISAYLEDAGVKGHGIVLNIAEKASIEETLAWMKDNTGYPEILVNNAAVTCDNLLLRMKDGEWGDVINTNLTGVFHLSKACLRPMMKARAGRIISISSVVGVTGNAGQANYAAAKAGVIGFSKSLAKEIATRNITVNVVAPGFIDTDMSAKIPEKEREILLNEIPAKRMGTVEDIAHTVGFLASPKSNYITGETLHVNGGLYMP